MSVQTLQIPPFNQTSTFTFAPDTTGIVICEARNSQGKTETKATVIVNDLDEPLSIRSLNTLPISIGDEVSVRCGALQHKYTPDLNWYKDGIPLVNSDSTYNII